MRRLQILFLTGLIWCSCREQELPCVDPTAPECPNYNPCLVFQAANAEFIIIDSLFSVDCADGRGKQYLVSEVDTTYTDQKLFFRALHNATTYEWHISGDPEIHDVKKFALYYPNSIAPSEIDVTLIACKEVPSTCSFKTCDTLTKTIYLINPLDPISESLVVGSFHGANQDQPQDTFTIILTPSFPLPGGYGIVNFPKGCIGQYLDVIKSRKGFILHRTPTICQSACGIGHLQEDRNTLIIDYSIKEGNTRVLKKFIGSRVK